MKQSPEKTNNSRWRLLRSFFHRNDVQSVLGAGLILISVSHWYPLGIHLLELFGAFAHFTLLLSVGVAVVSIMLKQRILIGFGIMSALISGMLVIPHFSSIKEPADTDFSVGHFNLYHHNPSPDIAFNSIADDAPDVFTVQEMNTAWSSLTDSLFAPSHPYTVEVPMKECCYGMGLFSRFPIVAYKVLDLEETPVIIAQLLVDGSTITFISLHTRPPAFPNETERRNQQLETVASIAAAETTDCIVLGDFNVVPWDAVFQSFLEQGNLTTVRDGFQATYPMDLGFPLIPIDHITFSGNLRPTSSQTVRLAGSDHRGLVAGFAFAD